VSIDLDALVQTMRLTAGHMAPVVLMPHEALALVAEVERLRVERAEWARLLVEDEARRAERAEIVAWLRTEVARYRRLEPVLSPAARALEATAYRIETHAPHAADLPESGRHRARERGNNER
jgi:hypothetical protein